MSNSHETIDFPMAEILLFIICIVLMRGCYHQGRIADKVSPETSDNEPQHQDRDDEPSWPWPQLMPGQLPN